MTPPEAPQLDLGPLCEVYEEALAQWEADDGTRRLLRADARLWTAADEANWLGWLDAPQTARPHLSLWQDWSRQACSDGIRDVLILGMGGSSLCPDVLARTLGSAAGFPRMHVLDSTVPAEIRSHQAKLDPRETLFVVPSKSGSTIEPEMLKRSFHALTREAVGSADAGRHFVAITDPGSPLEAAARSEGFRHVAHGVSSIGGRFSALSAFGLLPAALLGIDLSAWLARAESMQQACASPAAASNPGVSLGIALGALAREGRDKLTLVLSPAIAAFGSWLEQLIAESTGKQGRGILPVDGEALESPDHYGEDRLFVYLRLEEAPDPLQDERVAALVEAGQPVLRIHVRERYDLAAEFYRWEIATAVAGSLLGVNPFDQPDVESAKVAARELMTGYAETGHLPETEPKVAQDGARLYADEGLDIGPDVTTTLAHHLARVGTGDYFAINAFIERNTAHATALSRLREAVRTTCKAATTVGFGPRFLHSTGQLHKGGPTAGVFLEITANDPERMAIPGESFDFGVLNTAQAEGDFRVLCDRGRRVLHVALDPGAGFNLEQLIHSTGRALASLPAPSKRNTA